MMRRAAIAAIAASVMFTGCERPPADEATVEAVGEGVEFERSVSAVTVLDWNGNTATDALNHLQPAEFDAAGGVSTGGFKWGWTDNVVQGISRFMLPLSAGAILLMLIGTMGKVLGSTGGLSKILSYAVQAVTFPIPLLGGIVQAAKAGLRGEQLKQVVNGGEAFKRALYKAYNDDTADDIWALYKNTQVESQPDATTRAAVDRITKGR